MKGTPIRTTILSHSPHGSPYNDIQSFQGTPFHGVRRRAMASHWTVPSHQEPQAVAEVGDPPQLRQNWEDIDRRMHANRSAYDGLILARVRDDINSRDS
jgi:hypothetical protein